MSSSKTSQRTIRIKAVDDTTPVLLGLSRTFRAVATEIRTFRLILRLLEEEELIAATTSETLSLALSAIRLPLLAVAAGIGILAAVQLTQNRAIIPVGQTGAGQFRNITSTGPIYAHAGEVLGRPGGVSSPQGGGGGGFSVNVQQMNVTPTGGLSDIQSGRFFRTMRDAYSSDVPMS